MNSRGRKGNPVSKCMSILLLLAVMLTGCKPAPKPKPEPVYVPTAYTWEVCASYVDEVWEQGVTFCHEQIMILNREVNK